MMKWIPQKAQLLTNLRTFFTIVTRSINFKQTFHQKVLHCNAPQSAPQCIKGQTSSKSFRLNQLKQSSLLISVLFIVIQSLNIASASQNPDSVVPASIDEAPKLFNAEYVAFRSGNDVGSALLSLQSTENGHYELVYRSKLSRFFLSDKRYEKTLFTIENNEYVPVEYQFKRSGTGPNKSLALVFDKQNKQVTIDEKSQLEWEGELDNQLFRIDLPKKLHAGATETAYDFINYRGEKRRYEVSVIAEENLSLPYGQLNAIKVKIARESNSRVTFAWFAPSLGYNLVRLQQFKDDKEQGDIQLDTFTYL